MTTYFNMDTSQYFYDSGYSDTASPGSSSTSPRMYYSSVLTNIEETTSKTFHYLTLSEQPQTKYKEEYKLSRIPYDYNQIMGGKKPKLVILEEPIDKFRFRYKSEMHGTHGSLMGVRSEKTRKTYPTVQLQNFVGHALIRCSLYQTDTLKRLPHSHKLVVRTINGEDQSDPHDLFASAEEGYKAIFQGMGIIHTAKKNIVDELIFKKMKEKKFELGRELTTREESQLKISAEKEARDMNLNQVCLEFRAFAVSNDNKTLTEVCDPVYSRPINNMKSALTGELKIVRLSAVVSSAAGGTDLFLFVEKVGKKNIKVRFFEVNDFDEVVWEGWGIFSESDVHHQYAIALRTPPYKDKDIFKSVDVFIQLERPSDGVRSEPVPFKYKPVDFVIARKRARMVSSNSFEIPQTLYDNRILSNEEESFGSKELNKSDELDAFLEKCKKNSNELFEMVNPDFMQFFEDTQLDTDGVGGSSKTNIIESVNEEKSEIPKSIKLEDDPYLYYFKKLSSVLLFEKTNKYKAQEHCLSLFHEANQNDCNLLHFGIMQDKREHVLSLLVVIRKLGLSEILNQVNSNKQNCLHIACGLNKSYYISILIQLGANPNASDKMGNTPLHIAVEKNFEDCVVKLLSRSTYLKNTIKLKINSVNDDGLTALHLAIRNENLLLIKKLCEANASVKIKTSKDGSNPLHLAIKQENLEIIKYLLNSTEVEKNEKDFYGLTPMKIAYSIDSDERKKPIIKLLYDFGGKLDLDEDTIYENESDVVVDDISQLSGESNSSYGDDEYVSEGSSSDNNVIDIENYYENNQNSNKSTNRRKNSNSLLLDSLCIQQLSIIFDKDEKWRQLADLLNLSTFTCLWVSNISPTQQMLNHINCYEKNRISIENLIDATKKLKEFEAVKYLKNMLER